MVEMQINLLSTSVAAEDDGVDVHSLDYERVSSNS